MMMNNQPCLHVATPLTTLPSCLAFGLLITNKVQINREDRGREAYIVGMVCTLVVKFGHDIEVNICRMDPNMD